MRETLRLPFLFSRMATPVLLSEACNPQLHGPFKSLYRKYTETSAQRVRCPTHALHRCPLRWQHSFVCSSTPHSQSSMLMSERSSNCVTSASAAANARPRHGSVAKRLGAAFPTIPSVFGWVLCASMLLPSSGAYRAANVGLCKVTDLSLVAKRTVPSSSVVATTCLASMASEKRNKVLKVGGFRLILKMLTLRRDMKKCINPQQKNPQHGDMKGTHAGRWAGSWKTFFVTREGCQNSGAKNAMPRYFHSSWHGSLAESSS